MTQNAKRAALRAAYDALVKGGDQYLHYVTGDQLFGHPLINPTVRGTCDPASPCRTWGPLCERTLQYPGYHRGAWVSGL